MALANIDQKLPSSQKYYHELLNKSGMAVAIFNQKGILEKINKHFEILSGYQKCEIEKKCHYLQFVHPRDLKRVKRIHEKRLKGSQSALSHYRFAFLDRWGLERFVHVSVDSLPNSKDQICTFIDLSGQQQLEQETQQKDQFLANILRHSVDAIITLNSEGRIHSWNRGAEIMFEYTSQDVIGKRLSFLFSSEFQRTPNAQQLFRQFYQKGFIKNVLVEGLTKSGQAIVIDITQTAISNSDGKVIGSSAIIRDITAQKRAEQRIIHQEKMLELGELAGILAHEIKNPLNSMAINSEILRDNFQNLPASTWKLLDKHLNVVMSEVRRLNEVMERFLDFTRPIEGTYQKVELKKILTHVVELLSGEAKRSKIDVQFTADPKLPLVEGVRDHLTQVFLNLILNAFQALPQGGKVRIQLKAKKRNNIKVLISDTGVGISKEHGNRIFDLYFSTKEKGSGLGLSLVKRLVIAHGGKISFRSKLGHGTTFSVIFPAA